MYVCVSEPRIADEKKRKFLGGWGGGGVLGHAPQKILKVETKICAI